MGWGGVKGQEPWDGEKICCSDKYYLWCNVSCLGKLCHVWACV